MSFCVFLSILDICKTISLRCPRLAPFCGHILLIFCYMSNPSAILTIFALFHFHFGHNYYFFTYISNFFASLVRTLPINIPHHHTAAFFQLKPGDGAGAADKTSLGDVLQTVSKKHGLQIAQGRTVGNN